MASSRISPSRQSPEHRSHLHNSQSHRSSPRLGRFPAWNNYFNPNASPFCPSPALGEYLGPRFPMGPSSAIHSRPTSGLSMLRPSPSITPGIDGQVHRPFTPSYSFSYGNLPLALAPTEDYPTSHYPFDLPSPSPWLSVHYTSYTNEYHAPASIECPSQPIQHGYDFFNQAGSQLPVYPEPTYPPYQLGSYNPVTHKVVPRHRSRGSRGSRGRGKTPEPTSSETSTEGADNVMTGEGQNSNTGAGSGSFLNPATAPFSIKSKRSLSGLVAQSGAITTKAPKRAKAENQGRAMGDHQAASNTPYANVAIQDRPIHKGKELRNLARQLLLFAKTDCSKVAVINNADLEFARSVVPDFDTEAAVEAQIGVGLKHWAAWNDSFPRFLKKWRQFYLSRVPAKEEAANVKVAVAIPKALTKSSAVPEPASDPAPVSLPAEQEADDARKSDTQKSGQIGSTLVPPPAVSNPTFGFRSTGSPVWPNAWAWSASTKIAPLDQASVDESMLGSPVMSNAVSLLKLDDSSDEEDHKPAPTDETSILPANSSTGAVVGTRGLTELQMAMHRAHKTKAHAAARERAVASRGTPTTVHASGASLFAKPNPDQGGDKTASPLYVSASGSETSDLVVQRTGTREAGFNNPVLAGSTMKGILGAISVIRAPALLSSPSQQGLLTNMGPKAISKASRPVAWVAPDAPRPDPLPWHPTRAADGSHESSKLSPEALKEKPRVTSNTETQQLAKKPLPFFGRSPTPAGTADRKLIKPPPGFFERNTEVSLSLNSISSAGLQQSVLESGQTMSEPWTRAGEASASSQPAAARTLHGPYEKAEGSVMTSRRSTNASLATILDAEFPTSGSKTERNKLRSPLADLVGSTANIAAERLPIDRIKRYYPQNGSGRPPNAARYRPIPDSWALAYPLSALTPTGRSRTPEEQARYLAKVNKVFYSCVRIFGMSMDAIVEEVRLRHIWAHYLASLGISRAEYDRDLNRYAVVKDGNTWTPPYAPISVQEFRVMETAEAVAPLLDMLFRNLLLYRAEEALPTSHFTWRSCFQNFQGEELNRGDEDARVSSCKACVTEADELGSANREESHGNRRHKKKGKHLLGYAC